MGYRPQAKQGPAGSAGDLNPYILSGAISSRATSTRFSDIVNAMEYGAIADGGSHPLSGRYGSLGAAQAAYPFATSLTQEIDYCACKAASNAAFGADGFENASGSYNNKKLFIPGGQYWFGNDTWLIRNLVSGSIEGAGKLVTNISSNKTALAFDGVWYTEIANLGITTARNDATAAFELDGNIPGHPYDTRGVQGVTLRNIIINGGASDYCLAMTRLGESGGQGSECLFLNCHMHNALTACYYQNGFNNVANTFVGGDMQGFFKNGIYAVGGTVHVFGTSFESNTGYAQIANDGYDIVVGEAGAFNFCMIYGCRSESLRFLWSGSGEYCDVRGISSNKAMIGWRTATAYGTGQAGGKAIIETVAGVYKLFVATTEGTSGVSKPTFPASGTVSDNGIVWTQLDFDFINVAAGSCDRKSIQVNGPGTVNVPPPERAAFADTAVTTTYMPDNLDFLAVDATAGNKIVYVPATFVDGSKITVKKTDTSANTVTIVTVLWGIEDGSSSIVIPGGSRGSLTLQVVNPNALTSPYWLVVGKV